MQQTHELYEDTCENWIIAVLYGDIHVGSILIPKDSNIPLRTALTWLKEDSIPNHITKLGLLETKRFVEAHSPIIKMDGDVWTFYQECEYGQRGQ